MGNPGHAVFPSAALKKTLEILLEELNVGMRSGVPPHHPNPTQVVKMEWMEVETEMLSV